MTFDQTPRIFRRQARGSGGAAEDSGYALFTRPKPVGSSATAVARGAVFASRLPVLVLPRVFLRAAAAAAKFTSESRPCPRRPRSRGRPARSILWSLRSRHDGPRARTPPPPPLIRHFVVRSSFSSLRSPRPDHRGGDTVYVLW